MRRKPCRGGACKAALGFGALGWVVVAGVAQPAAAQSATPDKSQYSLFNPTPDSELRSFATDRPTKSNVPYTVDAGRFQYEMDLVNYFHQKSGTAAINSLVGPNPWLKLGITNNIDFEINLPAPQLLVTRNLATGAVTRASGFNDMFLRAKVNLWGNDGGKSAFALIPNLKIPTAAEGLGNGAVEGGLIAPLSLSLPHDVTLLVMSEVDRLKNLNGGGFHTNTINLINISRPIATDVTLYGELWSAVNFDPSRTIYQYSVDTSIAWTVRKNTQIDIGANIGLNRDTPAVQVYMGLAQRY